MGYLDNSYSNSNNGGSVNSQDSIWQMKSAAANGVNPQYDLGGYAPTESDYPAHQHYLPQREDYRESHNLSRQQFCTEPFATVVKSQKHVGEYFKGSMGGSYPSIMLQPCSSIDKELWCMFNWILRGLIYLIGNKIITLPKLITSELGAIHVNDSSHSIIHNINADFMVTDSQYDVSGLPYQEAYDGEPKPPQVSLSYDESLESGYSTPNSRRPRIIREIIV